MFWIVFDIEYIMSCSKKLPTQIISIGAVCLDNNGNNIDKFESYLKTINNINIPAQISDLTGITDTDLKNADAAGIILYKFSSWIRDYSPRILCCWGNQDIKIINDNSNFYKISYFTKFNYFDLQKSYMYYSNIREQPSLKNTLILENILTEEQCNNIKFHNSFTDAFYTSEILNNYLNDYRDDIKYNISGALYKNLDIIE